jgi:four helix bundle protein
MRDNDGFHDRTKAFASQVIQMRCKLPKSNVAQVLGKALVRSGTSVVVHYREASRSRSRAERASKLNTVQQRLDETLLWLELLVESTSVSSARTADLHREGNELLSMTAAAIEQTRGRR